MLRRQISTAKQFSAKHEVEDNPTTSFFLRSRSSHSLD
jgi:hypothetical protein